MKTDEVKPFIRRNPFRPFTVRLSNGATCEFPEPRFLGASQDGEALFYFAETGGFVLIDAENVLEIMSKSPRA